MTTSPHDPARYPLVFPGTMLPADAAVLVDATTGFPADALDDAEHATAQPLHAVMIRAHQSRACREA